MGLSIIILFIKLNLLLYPKAKKKDINRSKTKNGSDFFGCIRENITIAGNIKLNKVVAEFFSLII
jgi:hypothetical protein